MEGRGNQEGNQEEKGGGEVKEFIKELSQGEGGAIKIPWTIQNFRIFVRLILAICYKGRTNNFNHRVIFIVLRDKNHSETN